MRRFGLAIVHGFGAYIVTSLPVCLGVLFARNASNEHWAVMDRTADSASCPGDAKYYFDIAANGYSYNPQRASTVAFFPAYPLAARFIAKATGLPLRIALTVTANVFSAAAFSVMYWHSAKRSDSQVAGSDTHGVDTKLLTVFAMGLMPTTFYFRMPYSEGCFVLAALLNMRSIASGWPPLAIAGLVGITTATRPVGVALLGPLIADAWRRAAGRPYVFIASLSYMLPIGCWGISLYMLFQYWEFGDALAFVKTQANYSLVHASAADTLKGHLSWAPIWSVYDPTSPGYWRGFRPTCAAINLQFAEPLYFCGTALLIAVGRNKRLLSGDETLLSFSLLGITYFTRAFEMSMVSQGRFAAVVFPVYFVIEKLIRSVGGLGRVSVAIACACLMCSYTYFWLLRF